MSEKVFVDEINIGTRFRKELGDLEAMAASIRKKHGLIHPILVTKRGKMYDLVAGLRRLRAVKDILHWSKIEATIVDLDEGLERLEAEHEENELHKPPTVSERVSLVEAIKAKLHKRPGARTDISTHVDTLTCPSFEGEVESAAKKAGFGSVSTYERAKEAVANGTPEVVKAMDEGEISISAAAELSKAPPEEQKPAVKKMKKGKAKTARAALTAVKGDADEGELEDIQDADGKKVPADLHTPFQAAKDIEATCRELDTVSKRISESGKLSGWEMVNIDSVLQTLKNVRQTMWSSRATHICPYCHAKDKGGKACHCCKGRGWTIKAIATQAPKK